MFERSYIAFLYINLILKNMRFLKNNLQMMFNGFAGFASIIGLICLAFSHQTNAIIALSFFVYLCLFCSLVYF